MKTKFLILVAIVCVSQSLALAQSAFGPTRLASVASNGTAPFGEMANAPATGCSLSSAGRYVIFSSSAANLAPVDPQGKLQIYLRDRVTGVTTRLTNGTSSSTAGNNDSSNPSIADNGSVVVFQSLATNLTADDTNNRADVFLKDLSTGAISIIGKTRLGALNTHPTMFPAISSDGQRVVYLSYLDGNPPDTAPVHADVLLFDRGTGAFQAVDVNSSGADANDKQVTGWPGISGNGRFVVFGSFATNLSATSVSDRARVYIHDLSQGQTEHVSIPPEGEELFSEDWASAALPLGPRSVSYDGRYVAFGMTYSASPYPEEIYVRDRQRGVTTRVATSLQPVIGGELGLGRFWAAFGGPTAPCLLMRSPVANPFTGSGANGGIFSLDLRALEALSEGAYQLLAPGAVNPCASSDADVVGFDDIPQGESQSQVYVRAVDTCPSNPDKEQPGQCGCDLPDSDSDGNGVADCVEPTPTPSPSPTSSVTPAATPTLDPAAYRPSPPRFRTSRGVLWMTMERRPGVKYMVRFYRGRKLIRRTLSRSRTMQVRGLAHKKLHRADYAFAHRKTGRKISIFSARVMFKAP